VGGRVEVLMDGGVRSGTDVVKALAARGEQGLADYLGVLRREIAVTRALMGVTRIALRPEAEQNRTGFMSAASSQFGQSGSWHPRKTQPKRGLLYPAIN
jgi:hypothetical protein